MYFIYSFKNDLTKSLEKINVFFLNQRDCFNLLTVHNMKHREIAQVS